MDFRPGPERRRRQISEADDRVSSRPGSARPPSSPTWRRCLKLASSSVRRTRRHSWKGRAPTDLTSPDMSITPNARIAVTFCYPWLRKGKSRVPRWARVAQTPGCLSATAGRLGNIQRHRANVTGQGTSAVASRASDARTDHAGPPACARTTMVAAGTQGLRLSHPPFPFGVSRKPRPRPTTCAAAGGYAFGLVFGRAKGRGSRVDLAATLGFGDNEGFGSTLAVLVGF